MPNSKYIKLVSKNGKLLELITNSIDVESTKASVIKHLLEKHIQPTYENVSFYFEKMIKYFDYPLIDSNGNMFLDISKEEFIKIKGNK